MKTACHYAIVRFMPFVETEEFANVGVVLFAPQGRYFGFRLLGNRTSRITNFFEQVEVATYRAFMRDLREELDRVSAAFRVIGVDRRMRSLDVLAGTALWQELIKPRASLARFGEGRVVLAEDPQAKLQELYGYYVERNFVTREYREQVLERNVRQVLRAAQLAGRFEPARVGNEEYHVNFPFVQMVDERPMKAIKALTLTQADPARIIDHGGQWIVRVNNLRKRNLLPEQVLFAVDGDDEDLSLCGKARLDVMAELRALDVTVLPVKQEQGLVDFARH